MIQSRTLASSACFALRSARAMPPSSSGPGRGPLKAQTAVRVRLGAQKSHQFDGSFFVQTAVPREAHPKGA